MKEYVALLEKNAGFPGLAENQRSLTRALIVASRVLPFAGRLVTGTGTLASHRF